VSTPAFGTWFDSESRHFGSGLSGPGDSSHGGDPLRPPLGAAGAL